MFQLFEALAQTKSFLKPLFPKDPKGVNLPSSLPRMVDDDGNVVWIDLQYTTEAYRRAAFRLVLEEANRVAKELKLAERLPVKESDLLEAVINPFGYNCLYQRVGNVTSSNYCYYVSQGYKFSYLEKIHQFEDCNNLRATYTWPTNRIDTNQAYSLAVGWLNDVSVDVARLNRDCLLKVTVDPSFAFVTPETFVPVYWISWQRKKREENQERHMTLRSGVASVRLFAPTKLLLQLRVEDSEYILRKPLTFTNLQSLLPGVAPVKKLPPARPGGRLQPG